MKRSTWWTIAYVVAIVVTSNAVGILAGQAGYGFVGRGLWIFGLGVLYAVMFIIQDERRLRIKRDKVLRR